MRMHSKRGVFSKISSCVSETTSVPLDLIEIIHYFHSGMIDFFTAILSNNIDFQRLFVLSQRFGFIPAREWCCYGLVRLFLRKALIGIRGTMGYSLC